MNTVILLFMGWVTVFFLRSAWLLSDRMFKKPDKEVIFPDAIDGGDPWSR